jgi:hypothetical protein
MPEAVDDRALELLQNLAVAVAAGVWRPSAAVRGALADLAGAVARAEAASGEKAVG